MNPEGLRAHEILPVSGHGLREELDHLEASGSQLPPDDLGHVHIGLDGLALRRLLGGGRLRGHAIAPHGGCSAVCQGPIKPAGVLTLPRF